ncbi:hypothetical protein EGW08_018588, partial [Elysia chlorotica]
MHFRFQAANKMAAPLCKMQSRLCLHWNKLHDKAADVFMVRSFNVKHQKLHSRKKNRSQNEENGFDEFVAQSFIKSTSIKLKGKPSNLQDSTKLSHDQHSNRLPAPFIQVIRERYRQACRSVVIRTQNPER